MLSEYDQLVNKLIISIGPSGVCESSLIRFSLISYLDMEIKKMNSVQ